MSDAFALIDALARIDTATRQVLTIHADRVSTHYDDCWKYHVACLAARIQHAIKETQ